MNLHRDGDMRASVSLLVCVVSLSACSLPRDAGGTLETSRNAMMKVGIVDNAPWVIDLGDSIGGVEGKLADAIAAGVHARIEIVRGPEFELVRALHRRELQLLVGGFDRKVSWAPEVALTAPYLATPDGVQHVLAAPPGENAWLMNVETVLRYHKPSIPSLLAELTR